MTTLPAHLDFRASPWPTPLGLQPPSDLRVFGDPDRPEVVTREEEGWLDGNHSFELNDGATVWFPTEDVSNVDILTRKLTTLGFRRAN